MRLSLIGTIVWLSVAVLVGCGGGGGSGDSDDLRTETFTWSGPVAPGDLFEISSIAGDVTFTPGGGDSVEVEAVKSGRQDDPSTVDIVVVDTGDGIRICTLYPDVPGQAPNSCTPGGNLSSHRNDVEVDFTVRAPPGRRLEAGVIGGNLTALNMQNEVVLRTLGGDVTISTSEIAEANTFGGNITASIGSTDPSRDLAFGTLAGDVSVTVPSAINAEADLLTLSGTAASDFPLTEVGPDHLSGTLGAGGATLTLTSTAGNVRLLRAP